MGAKPFDISKREVWEAFKRVKANQGAAGVDGQSIEDFEARLTANLYKLWNRLSSGSYMPSPVRRVDIPKASGGTRPLGIPTVADRVAQEVVRRHLEPLLEPVFHPDSYGYRPGRSAIDAIRTARQRCWRADWVLDIDVKGFFDSIDHELLIRAVRKHTKCSWALLYIDRWLKAPAMLEGGELVAREQGTPQGGVISPLLANLFLHYAFDAWVGRAMPGVTFERYADDIICHCRSEREARELWRVVDERFATCGLVLHPQKTKLVYCKDTNRTGEHDCISFDFLGYTFRPRLARWRGGALRSLVPAGGEPHGSEGHQARGAQMGPSAAQRQGAIRHRADVQSLHSRVDRLLQPLLQIGALSDASPDRRARSPVGGSQVQALQSASSWRAGLACAGDPGPAPALRPLAASVWSGPDAGSRMS